VNQQTANMRALISVLVLTAVVIGLAVGRPHDATDESGESHDAEINHDPEESYETAAPEESYETAAPEESHETAAPEESYETDAPEESHETDVPDESHETAAPGESNEYTSPIFVQKRSKRYGTDNDLATWEVELARHTENPGSVTTRNFLGDLTRPPSPSISTVLWKREILGDPNIAYDPPHWVITTRPPVVLN
jgi:hypothetical protein